jgi:hypothetical protein
MDEGSLNTQFNSVQSYADAGGADATSLSHVLTASGDGLVAGKIYSFKFRARNAAGYSDFSDVVRVAL